MMRAIGRILKMISAMLRAGAGLALMPLAAIGGLFGGGAEEEYLPTPQRDHTLADTDPEVAAALVQQKYASVLQRNPLSYAYVYACQPKPVRDKMGVEKLPADIRVWAVGLSKMECALIKSAGLKATVDHIEGVKKIPGVRLARVPKSAQTASTAFAPAPRQAAAPQREQKAEVEPDYEPMRFAAA